MPDSESIQRVIREVLAGLPHTDPIQDSVTARKLTDALAERGMLADPRDEWIILTGGIVNGALVWQDDWDGEVHVTEEAALASYAEAIEGLGRDSVRLTRLLDVTPAVGAEGVGSDPK